MVRVNFRVWAQPLLYLDAASIIRESRHIDQSILTLILWSSYFRVFNNPPARTKAYIHARSSVHILRAEVAGSIREVCIATERRRRPLCVRAQAFGNMNSVAAANQEEAATIAAEFLSSKYLSYMYEYVLTIVSQGLDNLPNEVQHLLTEIRYKETRSAGMLCCPFIQHI